MPDPKIERLLPLDALRGMIMILMAIDHANYFVARMHPTGEFWGVPLPQYNDLFEFLTRFVTHLCAPGFFFLMGVGMVLFTNSRRSLGWTDGRILRHFLSRGLILIGFQFFFENTAWVMGPVYSFNPPGGGDSVWLHFGVLSALGSTMIIGALFLRSKPFVLVWISSAIIFGSQFLIPGSNQASHLYAPLLRILYIPGRTGIFQAFYPIIPWLGIVIFGLIFGKWLLHNKSQAYRWSFILGGIFLLVFIVLRTIGGFGNTHPPVNSSLVSYLNITKYPPSVVFTFLTLGLCLTFIGIFSRVRSTLEHLGKPLLVFGRSALFFYITHLYLFAFIGLFFASGGGTGLAIMYPIWFVALVILYFLCLWYGNFKKRKSADSIWRIF
jgi:uncharacterized membrane protein